MGGRNRLFDRRTTTDEDSRGMDLNRTRPTNFQTNGSRLQQNDSGTLFNPHKCDLNLLHKRNRDVLGVGSDCRNPVIHCVRRHVGRKFFRLLSVDSDVYNFVCLDMQEKYKCTSLKTPVYLHSVLLYTPTKSTLRVPLL